MARTSISACIVCLLICQQASPIDKAGLLSRYRNKFVVVTKEGLSTCLHGSLDPATLKILINEAGSVERTNVIGGDSTGLQLERPDGSARIGNGPVGGLEQIRRGEVLKVSHVSLSGRFLDIDLTVSPHVVEHGTGLGPINRVNIEGGSTELAIQASKGAGLDIADALAALAAQWLGPFDSAAEVEKALGVPQTRIDLGDKILYKYKDVTVEFQAGKVTDVR
jgi:hypothetical protein